MDNSIIHANIFFFVTTIAVVLVTLLAVVLLAYVVLILKDFRGVSRRVREEADLIKMDIDSAREHIKKKGSDMSSAFDFLKGFVPKKPPRNTKHK